MTLTTKDLMQLDFYEIFCIEQKSNESQIKKAFRKKALICHPDKNPDNPGAAAEFDKLKKILEILLDKNAREAYDRQLTGRKAAALRAREANARTRSLRADLEERERRAAEAKNKLSDEERFIQEVRRLQEEGERLIQEEIELLQKEARNLLSAAKSRVNDGSQTHASRATEEPSNNRVKVKWVKPEGVEHYTKEKIQNIFYKWGDLNGVAVVCKGSKGSALIDFKDKSAAEMAALYERGPTDFPLSVKLFELKSKDEEKKKSDISSEPASSSSSSASTRRDYETLADMQKRRKNERAKLMSEIMQADGLPE